MLRQQLNEDLKSAMRDKDTRRMGTLRLILAAVKGRRSSTARKAETMRSPMSRSG